MSDKLEESENSRQSDDSFEEYATEKQTGIAREFVDFLLHNKKWWLAPIIVVLFLVGLLVVLGGSGAAPWIYSLF